MARKISIIGSTGSIGVQAIEVAKMLGIEVIGITANKNLELFENQIRSIKPKVVSIGKENYLELKNRIKDLDIEVVSDIEGVTRVATLDEIDTVLTSVVGTIGLIPTIRAIENKKNVALANKETLVTAGQIVMNLARENNVNIFPVDSEHSAIFQCLLGNDRQAVERIILTASGGPFRGKKIDDLKKVTVKEALNHPNWSMGSKITIDSATLMNKGLEVIEAKWLFDIDLKNIDVIVHPQSIIHSMVEYKDTSVMAQLGTPDMKIPIQLALTYPMRMANNSKRIDFLKLKELTFEKPDIETFRCLDLAYVALKHGGTMPSAMNAANEIAVELFLKGKIAFLDISKIIEDSMGNHEFIQNPKLEDILLIDNDVRTRLKTKFKLN